MLEEIHEKTHKNRKEKKMPNVLFEFIFSFVRCSWMLVGVSEQRIQFIVNCLNERRFQMWEKLLDEPKYCWINVSYYPKAIFDLFLPFLSPPHSYKRIRDM